MEEIIRKELDNLRNWKIEDVEKVNEYLGLIVSHVRDIITNEE